MTRDEAILESMNKWIDCVCETTGMPRDTAEKLAAVTWEPAFDAGMEYLIASQCDKATTQWPYDSSGPFELALFGNGRWLDPTSEAWMKAARPAIACIQRNSQ